MIRVGQQRELQIVFLVELLLLCRCIWAYPNRGYAVIGQLFCQVSDAARLLRASRRVGFGIEI